MGTSIALCHGVRDAASLAGLILDQLDEGVVVLEAGGVVAQASRPFLALLEIEEDEVVGSDVNDLWRRIGARWADGRAVERGVGSIALERARAIGPMLVRLRSGAGEELICEERGIPLLNGRGELEGAVVTVRDVTALSRRTAALDRAYRQLTVLHTRLLRRGRARALAEAATTTALAVNNVLNAIGLGVRLQMERPSRERLDWLLRTVAEGAGLVERFQELTATRPSPAVASAPKVVQQAIELLRPDLLASAIDRPLQIDARIEPSAEVRVDERALLEAVCALLAHAGETAARGARVLVETRAADVGALIRVSFPRSRAADDEGVSEVVRAAIEGAGGRYSLRAGDSSFEAAIELPAASAGAPPKEEARAAGPRARRVLVVDDDEGNRSTLVELLGLHGYLAEGAATGAEAIERARGAGFDAALVDLALPDVGGWEVARSLRQGRRDMRIVIVTGWEASAARPPERGLVDEVFHKPVDIAALLRLLGEPDAGVAEDARGA